MNLRLSSSALVAAAFAAIAVTAAPASAAPERLGRAPGGDSFAVIDGAPYVAYAAAGGVRVAKFSSRWKRVGSVVRHAKGDQVRDPSVVSGPGKRPWLTWTENSGKKGFQVRVARFAHGKWLEVAGGRNPISTYQRSVAGYFSSTPQLAFLSKRPYVAFLEYDGIDTQARAVRLGKRGRRWENVGRGLTRPTSGPLRVAVAGGRLYLQSRDSIHRAPTYSRFVASSRRWKGLPLVQPDADSVGSGGIAGFHGRLHTLATFDGNVFVPALDGDGQWVHVGNDSRPDAPVDPQSIATDGSTLYRAYITGSGETPRLEVDFLAGSTWTALENGVPTGSVPKSAVLRGAAGGGVWVLSEETAAGASSFQLSLYNAAE